MLIIAIILTFLAAAEIDICVPSFPEIATVFHLTPFKTELLLGINLIFHCIASLFAGNLGDKYGKKTVMMYGVMLYILSNYVCVMVQSYEMLMVARALQGVAAAMLMVLAPLIVIDNYPKERQQSMMSMLNGICTIAICFAPTIGSYVALYLGWKANFVVLSLLGSVSFFLAYFMLPENDKKSHISVALKEYLPILKSKQVMTYILALSFSIGVYYTFVAMSSIIYVQALGVSLKDFGKYQGALTLTFGTVSILTGTLVKLLGRRNMFIISISMILTFITLCFFLVVNNVHNPVHITATILILSAGVVYPMNFIYTRALDLVEGAGGKVSALINISKWMFSIVGFQLASYFYTNDFRSTGTVMILFDICAISIVGYIYLKESDFRKAISG